MLIRVKDLNIRINKRFIKQNVCDNHYKLIRDFYSHPNPNPYHQVLK